MLNPINEMRRLSSRSYDELLHDAITNYGFCPNGMRFSKVELITYIVAVAAIRDKFANRITHPEETTTNYTRYHIAETDGSEYYLRLTDEQTRFIEWNITHSIDYSRNDVDILEDIEWETP